MLVSTLFTVLAASIACAAPINRRDVALDAAAVAEAQKFDATATRAFTGTTITTSDGRCLSVDPFSGDFRENLTPVNVVTCNGSKNQTWDVITSGVHNNVKGQALIVSSLTNACLNIDTRRAPGNQVLLFACGGRADGSGQVSTSQLYAFNGGAGPQALVPQVGNNAICLTVKNNLVDQTACNGAASASGAELFTFGGQAAGNAGAAATTVASTGAAATTVASTIDAAAAASSADCAAASTVTQTVTVTNSGAATTNVAVVQPTTPATTTVKATTTAATATDKIAVSGAGGTLNPTAVAEAQKKDNTATRAATGAQIKDSAGNCLFVDPNAGDFRENLIPVAVKPCDGSDNEKFDLITKGVHNDQAGQTLIVSSLTNGCLSFDSRRPLATQVHIFSCGGRADGSGIVATSQLFPFTAATLTTPGPLSPNNAKGTCFVNVNGALQPANCDSAADQLFTIVA